MSELRDKVEELLHACEDGVCYASNNKHPNHDMFMQIIQQERIKAKEEVIESLIVHYIRIGWLANELNDIKTGKLKLKHSLEKEEK